MPVSNMKKGENSAPRYPVSPKESGERGGLCAEVSHTKRERGEVSAQRFLPKNSKEERYLRRGFSQRMVVYPGV